MLRRNSVPEGFEKAEHDAAVAVAYWGDIHRWRFGAVKADDFDVPVPPNEREVMG